MRKPRLLFARGGGINWPGVLLVCLALASLSGLLFFGLTSGAAFDPFNLGWDGTSEFREQVTADADAELETITAMDRYETAPANETVAFVLAPDRAYGSDDAVRVREFVERGGTVVVMENFGSAGNALLTDIGADARVDGRLLRDEKHHDEAPTMPVANRIEAKNHTLTTNVEQLTLNYASAIEPNNTTVLIRASEFSYLTEDENSTLDNDTELDPYPVVTIEDIGNGTVVVVSDPSITINVMLNRPDNAAFLQQLATQRERVLFDLSHTENLPPLTSAVIAIRGSSLLQGLVGLALVGLVALLAEYRLHPHLTQTITDRIPGTSRLRQANGDRSLSTMSDEELAAHLRRTHPDWDEKRIHRVITAFKTEHTKERLNESHE